MHTLKYNLKITEYSIDLLSLNNLWIYQEVNQIRTEQLSYYLNTKNSNQLFFNFRFRSITPNVPICILKQNAKCLKF
jgi:hypothetical protein